MKKVSNEPLISVIIPVYKVEEYLNRCVDSVINQTYKNIEIILVDDGSPDNCPKICDDYAKKDKRIRVIHKKNGGLSDARNAGVDISEGEYLTFIDSDDYVEKEYIDFLYKLAKKYNAELTMGKQYVRYFDRTINTGSGNIYELNSHDALEKILYGEDFDVSAWAKLYKRELFKNIKFPVGRLFEDAATTYKLIDKANKIVLKSKPIYNYVIRNNSITNASFNEKKFDLIISTEEMASYVSKKYPDLEKACNRRVMYSYLSTLTQLCKIRYLKDNNKYIDRIFVYINKNRKKVLKDKRVPKRDRISLYLTKFGFRTFKICWNIYEKCTKRK